MAKEDGDVKKLIESVNEHFPELVTYFKITEDGKHVFEFYKKMEETIAVYKGTRKRKWLELVGVLEKTKCRDGTWMYKPTYIADVANIWYAILNVTNNLSGVFVDTSW